MKVVLVNTEFWRGGAARAARTLWEALNKSADCSAHFLYGRGPRVREGTAIRFGVPPEVVLHALVTRTTGLEGYGSWISTRRLITAIRRTGANIIHLHNLHGYYLNLGLLVRWVAQEGIPVVWTLHDGWAITGRCTYWLDCSAWRTRCGRCRHLSRYPKTFHDASALMWRKKRAWFGGGWSPVVICPSRWLASEIEATYLGRYRVEVIPHGIDTNKFRPIDKALARERLGLPVNKKVILFGAAKLSEGRKGANYFLEALRYLETGDYLVVTVGQEIDLCREFSHPFRIKQLGYITSEEDMVAAYNAADLFCVTSLHEVFGLVVTEAMACGTPVVGFASGGVADQVTTECGDLVPPKDVRGLAAALNKLLLDDSLRQVMGTAARARVIAHYSIERMRDRHIDLYSELLVQRSPAPSVSCC